MKNVIKAIIIASLLATTVANAQNQNELAIASEKAPYTVPVPNNEIPKFSENIKLLQYTATIKVNAADESITINYKVPANSNSAKVLIQDNNGRTLKDFTLYDKSKTSADFYISDLLAGTYNYVLMVNQEKVMAGKFELKN